MECPICLEEFAPNTGTVCSTCGNRLCRTCYDTLRNNYHCPTCRSGNLPFVLGEIPQVLGNQPIQEQNRCQGSYAGGTKRCTYRSTHQVDGVQYCTRCCKIQLRLARNSPAPEDYRIH